jgi:hypothetical protein
MKKVGNSILLLLIAFCSNKLNAQDSLSLTRTLNPGDSLSIPEKRSSKFMFSGEFIDAAINSFNSFQSLIKKENYRIKVISFNNPSSKELGFSLETEIQAALKPLLSKTRNTDPQKFSGIVSTLFQSPGKTGNSQTSVLGFNPLLASLISLVGTLVIQEKRITIEDLDSFLSKTSKFFLQYQKLNQANMVFDQDIQKLNSKMLELQFDIKEYMVDLVTIINNDLTRSQLKPLNAEELYLNYMQGRSFEKLVNFPTILYLEYPSDGIKNAKEIAYSLQKLFNDYQKIYSENYQQIRSILQESRSFGSTVNLKQVDSSLKELEELYNESRQSDVMGLRLNTLFERLRILVNSEQPGAGRPSR